IHTANTIEELARKAGIGPRLAITINDFNKALAAGKAAEMAIPKTDALNKIATPPFYAIPFVPGIPATYGGFLVSPKAEVLNLDKNPIKGLYAAGLLMEGSLSGGVENKVGAYVGCLGACLIFGLLAAENATA
ncbi:MAG: FAD-binding protein, partial [Dehalococcoidales bacterium]|nr:FAD-binding protein [Dehalococcoidales bacterium]